MKNKITLSLLISIVSVINVKSQLRSDQVYVTNDFKLNALLSNYNHHSAVPNLKNVSYSQKKETKDIYFDNEGNIIKVESTKNGKKFPLLTVEYLETNKPLTYGIYKNGKLKYTTTNYYNEKAAIIKSERTRPNQKQFYQHTWEYDQNNNLIKTTSYKNGSNKISSYWLYEYDNEGKKTASRSYNKKGELQYEYSFNCNPEGKKVEKKVDYTAVCSYTESLKDYLIKTDERDNLKGKLSKTLQKYLAADTTLIEHKSFNHKNQLVYHNEYNNSGKIILYEWYKRNKPKSVSKWTYDGNKFISRQNYWNGKPSFKLEYVYYKELITQVNHYNKDKLKSNTKITYNF